MDQLLKKMESRIDIFIEIRSLID